MFQDSTTKKSRNEGILVLTRKVGSSLFINCRYQIFIAGSSRQGVNIIIYDLRDKQKKLVMDVYIAPRDSYLPISLKSIRIGVKRVGKTYIKLVIKCPRGIAITRSLQEHREGASDV